MRLVTLLLVSTLLAGCIPVVMRSTVDADSRANVPENKQPTIQAGTSRRADVLLELGEPDGRAQDESWYVYSLTRTSGVGGILFVSNGALGGVVGSQDMTRIAVHFDPSGAVTSVEPEHLHCRYSGGFFGNAEGESKPCASPTGEDLEGAVASGISKGRENHGILINISADEILKPAVGAADVPLKITDRRTKSKLKILPLGPLARDIEFQPREMQLVRSVVQASLQEAIGASGMSGAPPTFACELVDFSFTASYSLLYWNMSARVEWVIRIGAQQRTVTAESKQRAMLVFDDTVKAPIVQALKQAAADTSRAATEVLANASD